MEDHNLKPKGGLDYGQGDIVKKVKKSIDQTGPVLMRKSIVGDPMALIIFEQKPNGDPYSGYAAF